MPTPCSCLGSPTGSAAYAVRGSSRQAMNASKLCRGLGYTEDKRRDESRRGTQECVRHEGWSRPVLKNFIEAPALLSLRNLLIAFLLQVLTAPFSRVLFAVECRAAR